MTALHPDKGCMNGRCNRTACQAPLAHERKHQFMDGLHTGGPRLYYCAGCSWKFDEADRQFREPFRIKREPKETPPPAIPESGQKVGAGQSQDDGQAQRMNPSSDGQVCLEEAAKAQPTLMQEA